MSPPRSLPNPYPIEPIDAPLDAVVSIPGSKSITNRALLCAALAAGSTRLSGVLFADDTEAMLGCVAALGAHVRIERENHVVEITGVGGELQGDPDLALDAVQSGTTARFIAATMMLSSSELTLDAAPQMRARPMATTFEALRNLGASVEETDQAGFLPARIRGITHSSQPTVRLPGDVSSQFLSGLLLAAPCLAFGLRLELATHPVSAPYLAMTVSVMRSFGAVIDVSEDGVYVVGPGGYKGQEYSVEPDASAASYFFAAAAICGGSVRIDGLGANSIQGDIKVVDVLERMGSTVSISPESITVTGGPIHGIRADFRDISDTAQTIAAVAVFADSATVVSGIGFIRAKETNRVAAVVSELRRCGVNAIELEDGFEIHPGEMHSAVFQTYDDHRMAMSFALIGLGSEGIQIADPSCVSKTFPDFFDVLESIRPELP